MDSGLAKQPDNMRKARPKQERRMHGGSRFVNRLNPLLGIVLYVWDHGVHASDTHLCSQRQEPALLPVRRTWPDPLARQRSA